MYIATVYPVSICDCFVTVFIKYDILVIPLLLLVDLAPPFGC